MKIIAQSKHKKREEYLKYIELMMQRFLNVDSRMCRYLN